MFVGFQLAVKNIVRQRRKAIPVVSVIACVAVVVIVSMNFDRDYAQMPSVVRVSEHGFYHLSTDFLTEGQANIIDLLDADNTITYSSYNIQKFFGFVSLACGQSAVVYGVDRNTPDFNQARLIRGQFPEALNEIVIEGSLVEAFGGADVGDIIEIEITLYNGESVFQQLKVSGILQNMPNRERHHGTYGIMYTTTETVMAAYGTELPPSRVLLRIYEDHMWVFSGFSHMRELEDMFYNATSVVWHGNSGLIGFRVTATSTLADIIPVMLIISLIIILGVFSVSLASREKQYRTLRHMGMERRSIFYMTTFEAALLGIVGWLIGVLAGSIFHQFVFRNILNFYWDTPITEPLLLMPVVYSFVVCVGISMLSGALMTLKFFRTGIKHKIKNPRKLLNKWELRNPQLFLLNALIRDRKNVIICISLVISMLLGVIVFFTTSQLRIWSDETVYDFDFELYIGNFMEQRLEQQGDSDWEPASSFDHFNYYIIDEIQGIDGVTNVWGLYYFLTRIDLEFERIFTSEIDAESRFFLDATKYEYLRNSVDGIVSVYAIIYTGDYQMFDEAFRNGIITDVQHASLLHKDSEINAIAMSYVYLWEEDIHRDIHLTGSIKYDHDGEIRQLEIIENAPHHIYSAGSGIPRSGTVSGRYAPAHLSIFVLNNNFFQNEEIRYHVVRITIDDNADRALVRQQLYQLLRLQRNAFLFDSQDEHNRQYGFAQNILLTMIALYLAIYFAMLYNTFNIIMASIDERREIYASLRRIGFDHSSLRKMVLSEMAFVGSAAAVIGFLIGIISVGLLEGNERSLSLIAMLGQHPWESYIILVIINISFALLVSLICISSNKFKEKIELL